MPWSRKATSSAETLKSLHLRVEQRQNIQTFNLYTCYVPYTNLYWCGILYHSINYISIIHILYIHLYVTCLYNMWLLHLSLNSIEAYWKSTATVSACLPSCCCSTVTILREFCSSIWLPFHHDIDDVDTISSKKTLHIHNIYTYVFSCFFYLFIYDMVLQKNWHRSWSHCMLINPSFELPGFTGRSLEMFSPLASVTGEHVICGYNILILDCPLRPPFYQIQNAEFQCL